ncbi:hypothetical protein AAKU67_002233 [Oxalobacteraceae bacterium GrIS 2.11]
MTKHAFLSPSGAPAWLRCHAKVWREKDLPDESSEAADEGTAAHFLMHSCLWQDLPAKTFLGETIQLWSHPESHCDGADFLKVFENGHDPNMEFGRKFPVDHDMVSAIEKAINWINSYPCEHLHSELSLPIAHITGEEGAVGTLDVTQIADTELCITDLKYGMGVQVFAEENEQLLIYADAALDEFDVMGETETVRMRIAQPRLDHFDEWVLPRAELAERITAIRDTAYTVALGVYREVLQMPHDDVEFVDRPLDATPGDKQCKFCRAKATCEEFRNHTLGAVTFEPVVDLKKGEIAIGMIEAEKLIAQAYGVAVKGVTLEGNNFIIKKPTIVPQVEAALERIATESDEQLATINDAADMLEGLIKAVRAEIERRLFAGTFSDARYKLVEGKRGARQWIDESDAEKVMKAMRLKIDQMYDMKVKSPTQIEKVIEEANPRKWAKLQDQITQGGGRPSVAPASDKRPALSMSVQFEPIVDDVEFIEAVAGLSIEDELI